MPGPSLTPSRPATLTFTLTLQVQVQFRSVRTLEFVNASERTHVRVIEVSS